jgi:hypothetical protein
MVVSHEEVNAMSNLLNILNSVEEGTPVKQTINSAHTAIVENSVDMKDDMKQILSRFYSAGNDAVNQLVEESHYSTEANDALNSKKTQNGVVIGQYEIRQRLSEGSGNTSFYDVVYSNSKQNIASDLILYEAALLLTRYLNKGEMINGTNIKKVLQLEETYYTQRADAIRFKKKAKQCYESRNNEQGSIFEGRFHRARENALVAKEEVAKLLKNIK